MHPVLEQFQKDTANHTMTVLHDDGLYRHLQFSNGGRAAYHFNITTWPGYLCISGDMGCYTFSRVRDMFNFFRDDRVSFGINPHYWQEKIQAGAGIPDRRLTMEWDPDAFKQAVVRRYKEWLESQGTLPEPEIGELIRFEIRNEVFSNAEFEESACMAVQNFDDSDCPGLFDDMLECTIDWYRFQFHYLWCCYAIVWGIAQYDRSKVQHEATT